MHKEGSLSWAADRARGAKVDVCRGPFDAYWNTHLHALCWRSTNIPVTVAVPDLGGWTVKVPVPESPIEGSRAWAIKMLQDGAGVPRWCGDSEREVGLSDDRTKLAWPPGTTPLSRSAIENECYDDAWHIKTPAPQTEDMPIEAFRRRARAIRSGSIFAELQFEASIQCYLYADGKGGFEEFCAERAFKDPEGWLHAGWAPHGGNNGDWRQPTHVRLLKKKEDGQ